MNDYSFLEESVPVADQLKGRLEHLASLAHDLAEKEAAYKAARARYEEYARGAMPELFHTNGVTSMTLSDGSTAEVKRHIKASISVQGKGEVAEWLERNGLGTLVSHQLAVPYDALPLLEEHGIVHADLVEMNTNSVKAALKDSPLLETKPAGLSWYEYEEVEVK